MLHEGFSTSFVGISLVLPLLIEVGEECLREEVPSGTLSLQVGSLVQVKQEEWDLGETLLLELGLVPLLYLLKVIDGLPL